MQVSKDIQVSKQVIKDTFQVPDHLGLIFRAFQIPFAEGTADAFLCYFDGMSNANYINRDLMRNLLQNSGGESGEGDRKKIILERMTPVGPLSTATDYQTAAEAVCFGNCIFFVDGCDCAFLADVKGWSGRAVGEPSRESSLTGPQEAFNEIIVTNLALIRKILKTPALMAEHIPIGSVSKTPCALMYLKGVTNEKLVDEVRRRLQGIDTSYIFSTADVELLIEDATYLPMVHMLKTERPDRAAAMLAEGKVVVMVNGSPFALVLPTCAADLIAAAEDPYARVTEANFMRLIRLFGLGISVLLPGFFLSLMLFHHQVLPTQLLLAIEATREAVPFSLLMELLLMELAFELIQEASVRVPGPIGSTLGIIGGLILGQAAVEASLVSPMSIIVVSLSGLGTFASPSVDFSRSLSLLRLGFLFAAALCGLLGMVCAGVILLSALASLQSVSVPFLSPFAPHNGDSVWGSLMIKPIWKKELRPRNLHARDIRKQPPISRIWKYQKEDHS